MVIVIIAKKIIRAVNSDFSILNDEDEFGEKDLREEKVPSCVRLTIIHPLGVSILNTNK